MEYEGTPIRPPSEADSIILQVTVGCSHNRCTFCGAYRGVRFRIKDEGEIEDDLAFARRHCRRLTRVFLADGDVLSLAPRRLAGIIEHIRRYLPWVRRISAYGNAKNLRHRSVADLAGLRRLGLDRIYLGLESGDDQVLARVRKGVDAATMVDVAAKVRRAGIFLSVTALLGLAGDDPAASRRHARRTGEVLAAMAPNQVAILALMLLEGTELAQATAAGTFRLPSPAGMLAELEEILAGLAETRCQFHANHPSNYLSLAGRLPRDYPRLRQAVARGRRGETPLRPEALRCL